jgi:hypothetical protein
MPVSWFLQRLDIFGHPFLTGTISVLGGFAAG